MGVTLSKEQHHWYSDQETNPAASKYPWEDTGLGGRGTHQVPPEDRLLWEAKESTQNSTARVQVQPLSLDTKPHVHLSDGFVPEFELW